MKRRDFIAGLGSAAAWPMAVRAQQAKVPVIGYLRSDSPRENAPQVVGFRQGLQDAGFREGQNVAIEYRSADGQIDRLPALAADLVRQHVTVIVASGIAAPQAAKAATTTIPIVFTTGSDPVALGLVASLNQVGGNLTGTTSLGLEIGPKRLELMHEMVPSATVIALLVNPTIPNAESLTTDMQAAARIVGVHLHVLHANTERDIDVVIANWAQLRAGPLVIGSDGFFNRRAEQLAALTVRHALPAIHDTREFAAAGGLMSYGSSTNSNRVVGVYVGRILKGDKPADLPVQQAARVELTLNLKTAKALGIEFPTGLLVRADEVIE